MNFKLTLQYDGTDFHGWQMQGAERTVQVKLADAPAEETPKVAAR